MLPCLGLTVLARGQHGDPQDVLGQGCCLQVHFQNVLSPAKGVDTNTSNRLASSLMRRE